MVFIEVCARLGVALLLAVCLCPRRYEIASRTAPLGLLALLSCGCAIAAEMRGVRLEAAIAAALLCPFGVIAGELRRYAGRMPDRMTLILPFAASVLGCLVGQGLVLLPVTITILITILDMVTSRVTTPGTPRSTGVLRIRAQNIHGLMGRIESILERVGVTASHLEVVHHPEAKEITILLHLARHTHLTRTSLVAALHEVEGLIQLALE